ncbi:MAG: tRNA uridine-5-carboxymethylaminomethyl(34) synthesis GTPase MnmE [Pseudomonadales bacterium]|nr:tRNA uridine-5-carboxymethylaminomethyl(34) synthesis GTPase MnmE [Pseudomonadales bacterium]
MHSNDTIAAIATPSGRGGIGVVRVSGPSAGLIGEKISSSTLQARHAQLCDFTDASGRTIDRGIALYFVAPHSYTGEDVLELQGHGNSFVLDELLQRTFELGARPARPGEFTERAFLNDKIDLAQAEAIADTISSNSRAAARSAVASLVGRFSEKIDQLLDSLTQLRTYVEATIDFPEEELDLPNDDFVNKQLNETLANIQSVLKQASAGNIIRDGLSVVIVGAPNAGKSSLLNRLSGEDIAIVSETAGTTRDMLRSDIELGGIPLRLVDTAGLREASNEIEREGIRRAGEQVAKADIILFVKSADNRISNAKADDLLPPRDVIAEELARFGVELDNDSAVLLLYNKIDLFSQKPRQYQSSDLQQPLEDYKSAAVNTERYAAIGISALKDQGIGLIAQTLQEMFALQQDNETTFTARQRHVDTLRNCQHALVKAKEQLHASGAAELFAEDLRSAQMQLAEITGRFSSDDLLGEIFSSFCIGK